MQRSWFVSAIAHLGEYQAAMAADRESGRLTEKGLAERAAGHRDPVVALTERFSAKRRDREAAVAASEAAAWKDELARPPGVSEGVDAIQLADVARQLAGLADHEQHQLLLEDSDRGRMCRRAGFVWPALRSYGLPQTAGCACGGPGPARAAGLGERRGA